MATNALGLELRVENMAEIAVHSHEAYQRLLSSQYLIGVILVHEPTVRLYLALDRLASTCALLSSDVVSVTYRGCHLQTG